MIITLDFGWKDLRLTKGYYNSVVFSCNNSDVNSAYEALADSIMLKDSAYEIIFEILKDYNDVKSMLKAAKQQGFISDYEIN